MHSAFQACFHNFLSSATESKWDIILTIDSPINVSPDGFKFRENKKSKWLNTEQQFGLPLIHSQKSYLLSHLSLCTGNDSRGQNRYLPFKVWIIFNSELQSPIFSKAHSHLLNWIKYIISYRLALHSTLARSAMPLIFLCAFIYNTTKYLAAANEPAKDG